MKLFTPKVTDVSDVVAASIIRSMIAKKTGIFNKYSCLRFEVVMEVRYRSLQRLFKI